MAYCRLGCPTGAMLNDISGAAGKTWNRRDSLVLVLLIITVSLMMIFGSV